MPILNEIKYGRDISPPKIPNRKFIWSACLECKTERWVALYFDKPLHQYCPKCSHSNKRVISIISDKPPQIGEVRQSKHITGAYGSNKGNYRIWSECPDCGKQRWTSYYHRGYRRCPTCANIAKKKIHHLITTPPYVGEIRHGKELGKNADTHYYIYSTCPICGKQRWVDYSKRNKSTNFKCQSCSVKCLRGDNSPNWKGGITKNSNGYIIVTLYPNDFYFNMGTKRRNCSMVLEHRLVMAKYLGRCLQSWELVHHKNGIKDDNRIENLELSTMHTHITDHNKGYKDGFTKGYTDGKSKKIEELEMQIATYKSGTTATKNCTYF